MTEWGAVQSFASRATSRLQASQGPAALLIDLTTVTHADTKLIACLVCLTASARHAKRSIAFRFSPQVRDWIVLCGLEQVLSGRASSA